LILTLNLKIIGQIYSATLNFYKQNAQIYFNTVEETCARARTQKFESLQFTCGTRAYTIC